MNDMFDFDGKDILIWGYGREGRSTEDYLKRCCSPRSVEIYEGSRDGIDADRFDYIFKSPGIRMDEEDPKFISQTEVFLRAFRDQVIGITGTKGKSTTSTLLYKVLSDCTDRQVLLLGNMGLPCLDAFEKVDNDTIVVYEMSCHQLKHLDVSPHIAIFLNLYEEHLDYYDTVERYFKAKSHIAMYQKNGDRFYRGSNVPKIETDADVITISPADVRDYDLKIPGDHNKYNAEFVFRIATEDFGCDPDGVRKSMQGFEGLPHRLQLVKRDGDVSFYDDSISTIPEAAISALTSIPDARTVLIGGMDRGIDYSKLTDFIPAHPEYNYVCMYASGKRIYETDGISKLANVYYEEDLEAAVAKAVAITSKGAVILSPAAASYDHFKNFEERGDCFTKLIML